MQNEDEKKIDMVGDLKVRSEDIGFDADQMIACPRCGKSNPPNRTRCFYCSAEIESTFAGSGPIKLNLRRLEGWENGYNVILRTPAENVDVTEVARLFGGEPDHVEKLLAAESAVPLARLESERDAAIAEEFLKNLGLNVCVVSDIDLKIGKPNVRLRSVEFLPEGITATAFNTSEKRSFTAGEITSIVTGVLIESKIASVEKGRKKGERKTISETATASDDVLIDIYDASGEQGWRIQAMGFDFSGLGKDKGLLASENIGLLIDRIKQHFPAARFVDDYRGIMNSISTVWEPESRTDFGGLKKTGVWSSGFENVVRTSNLEQFSKYSRLQRILQ